MEEYKQITSVQSLIDTLNEEPETACQFFIQLAYGVRSWKVISWDNGEHTAIYVLNEIDESEETIDLADLNKTIIGESIEKGALYFAWR